MNNQPNGRYWSQGESRITANSTELSRAASRTADQAAVARIEAFLQCTPAARRTRNTNFNSSKQVVAELCNIGVRC